MSENTRILLSVSGLILILIGIGLYLGLPGVLWLPVAMWVIGLALAGVGLLKGRDLRRLRSSRSLYYGTSSTVLTLVVIAIVVLVNVIAEKDFHVRWDLTANKLYSLSDQTLTFLKELDTDVTAHAFVRESDTYGRQIVNLLKEYTYRSDRIRLNTVDPDAQPALARQYEVNQYNTVVIEAGDRRRTVQPFDLFSMDPYGQQLEFSGEQALTRAFLGVTRGSMGTVYFTTGHGERALDNELTQLRSYLTGEGYDVKELNLAQSGKVPDDATVLVIAGPERDFDAREVDAVRDYIEAGKHVFMLIDPMPATIPLARITGLVRPWGITFHQDVVVDPERHYFIDALSPIPTYEPHDITKDLIEKNLGLVLPHSRSLAVGDPEEQSVNVEPIFRTSNAAWGETRLTDARVAKGEDDVQGPLTLGAVVEKGNARVVVVGTSSFIANDAIAFQGNVDFFVNGVNWLAGHEETLTIRPKRQDMRQVAFSGAQASVIFYSTVVLIPLLFLAGAGAVAWRRRHL